MGVGRNNKKAVGLRGFSALTVLWGQMAVERKRKGCQRRFEPLLIPWVSLLYFDLPMMMLMQGKEIAGSVAIFQRYSELKPTLPHASLSLSHGAGSWTTHRLEPNTPGTAPPAGLISLLTLQSPFHHLWNGDEMLPSQDHCGDKTMDVKVISTVSRGPGTKLPVAQGSKKHTCISKSKLCSVYGCPLV